MEALFRQIERNDAAADLRQLSVLTAAIGGAFSEDRSAVKRFSEHLAQLAAGETPDPKAEAERNRRAHVAALSQAGSR